MKIAVKENIGIKSLQNDMLKYYYEVKDDYNFSGNSAIDVTTHDNLNLFYSVGRYDFLVYRNSFANHFYHKLGFSGLTEEDKYNSCINVIPLPEEIIPYWMGKGMTQVEAQTKLISDWAKYHNNRIDSLNKRVDSESIFIALATYLDFADVVDLVTKIRNLIVDLKNQGILGHSYGNIVTYGVMDWIESTAGSPYENSGLKEQNYSIKVGTVENLINRLHEILVDGIY